MMYLKKKERKKERKKLLLMFTCLYKPKDTLLRLQKYVTS